MHHCIQSASRDRQFVDVVGVGPERVILVWCHLVTCYILVKLFLVHFCFFYFCPLILGCGCRRIEVTWIDIHSVFDILWYHFVLLFFTVNHFFFHFFYYIWQLLIRNPFGAAAATPSDADKSVCDPSEWHYCAATRFSVRSVNENAQRMGYTTWVQKGYTARDVYFVRKYEARARDVQNTTCI